MNRRTAAVLSSLCGLALALPISAAAQIGGLADQPDLRRRDDRVPVNRVDDLRRSEAAVVEAEAEAEDAPATVAPMAVPTASATPPAALPTLFPRQLPRRDRNGEDFADRVSISPDGRRLLVGTQQGTAFGVQVAGVNRKDVEGSFTREGRLAFVGWANASTGIVGYERGEALRVERYDVTTGRSRLVHEGGMPGGVLATGDDASILATSSRATDFACTDGTTPPSTYEGDQIVQAGPVDAEGRIVYRTTGGERGALVPFDCDADSFGEPLYEGEAFDGALFDTASRRYLGVWDDDGLRYIDPSLAYEMAEVAVSFPGEVDVYPIEFTASPNTLLLYVVGDQTPGAYYVLDRYAGQLDLHVSYAGAQ